MIGKEERIKNLKRNIDYVNILNIFENLMKQIESEKEIFQFISIMMDFIIKNQAYLNSEELNNLLVAMEEFINFCNRKEDKSAKVTGLYENIVIQFTKLQNHLKNAIQVNVYFLSSDHYKISEHVVQKEYLQFIKLDPNVDLNDINHVKIDVCKNEKMNIFIADTCYVEKFYHEIEELQFDSILIYENVIAELYRAAVHKYFRNYDYNYLNDMINVSKNDENIKTLITGLSYSLFGIEPALLKGNGMNLSLASQDIYYSFKIIKDIINENKSIENCVIGLAYYSFYFDLSRGSEAKRIGEVYDPLFNDGHHYEVSNRKTNIAHHEFENYVPDVIKIIFNVNELEQKMIDNYYNEVGLNYFNRYMSRKNGSLLGNSSLKDLTEQQKVTLGTERAESHNKIIKYEETAKENTRIFEELLQFLKEHDIKPIIVIFPTTKYYREKLDSNYKKIFYNKLSHFSKEYKLEIIDLFDSDRFNESDFLDFDHLDDTGAKKVTNVLNDML
ncbi:hypothetical protein QCI42_12780 [Bacillus fungorum]|uniref:hypothetical protein n=1 Tax=Bacillus fungorum TaxID=2039284 RepID=UPI00339629F8